MYLVLAPFVPTIEGFHCPIDGRKLVIKTQLILQTARTNRNHLTPHKPFCPCSRRIGMEENGVTQFFFCFDSFIFNPLHAARGAIAAAGFSKLTFSYPEPACAVIVEYPRTPSPHGPPNKRKKINTSPTAARLTQRKAQHRSMNTLEGRAWPILLLTGADLGSLLLPMNLQRETLQLLFQIRTPS